MNYCKVAQCAPDHFKINSAIQVCELLLLLLLLLLLVLLLLLLLLWNY